MARKVKVPRLFAVELSARVFERKILRRIYIVSDREFLEGLYLRQPEGGYRRPEGLDEVSARRLRELARAVGKNKGVVRLGKVSVIAVIAAALLVFSLFFRDRLAEAGLERALEGIFSARAEVDDLRLRLLRGRVAFHRLAVADQEQPMRNLFELGRSALSVDTGELLRGRVLVRTLESRDIRWGTPRESSGALEPAPPEAEAQAEERGGLRLSLPGLDVGALLEQQSRNLRSPAAVEELNARVEQLNRQWADRLDASEQTLRRLSDQVESLQGLDAGAVRTIPEAQRALGQVQGLYPTLQSARQQATEVSRGLAADAQEAAKARGAIAGVVEADVAYLKSFTDLSGAGLRGLLASIATPYLERYLGGYSKYALRALDYGRRLVARQPEKDRKAGRGVRRDRGREVPFPVRQSPRFLLQDMRASFGTRGEAYSVRFSLQNLSSDPDLTGAPVSAAADIAREDRASAVAGRLDLRQGAQERLSVGLETFGQPLELGEGLEAVNLRQVRGRLDLRSDLSLDDAGGLRGGGRLSLRDLVLETSGETDIISAAIYDTVSSAPELIVDFRFASEGERAKPRVSATTNLDDVLGARLKDSLAAVGAQQEQQLRSELRRRLEPQLARGESLNDSLTALQGQAGGNLQDIAGYEKFVAQKRSELEAQLKKLGGGALKGLPGGLSLP